MEGYDHLYGASLDELKMGYAFDPESGIYVCLICGERYEDGYVYPSKDGRSMEAHRAAARHIGEAHVSMLDYLLSLDKKATGLTDLQKKLIGAFASGMSDAEMVELTGAGSASTIRNHRFALKEKARQARLFLAVVELMEEGPSGSGRSLPSRRLAPLQGGRYSLTQEEYQALLAKYLPNGLKGPLTGLPRKEKRRMALLRCVSGSFKKGRKYSEQAVDDILKRFMADDFATLRTQLVEYRFLSRKEDGSAYWLTV